MIKIDCYRDYYTKTQRIVCEARKLDGYNVFPCQYMGRLDTFACTKGNHTLVIDTRGYDVFTRPIY